MSRGIITLIILVLTSASGAYAGLPGTGKIVNRVECREAPGQSYALYLPTRYTDTLTWPIIYSFDPAAQGSTPVKCFRAAAEKYGYIVVGSNNARNAPYPPILAAFKAMRDDTHARYSIDPRRIYFTGFSGAARVACTLAAMQDEPPAGVIAHGGGFGSAQQAHADLRFAFFGTAGTDDFNREEMEQLDIVLDTLRVPHRIRIFEGDHTWAPAPLCMEAVEWMELKAMQCGIKKLDDRLIRQLFEPRYERARLADKESRQLEAWRQYGELAEDFDALHDLGQVNARIKILDETLPVLREQVRLDKARAAEQAFHDRVEAMVMVLAAARSDPAKLRSLIEELQRKVERPGDNEEKRLALTVHQRLRTYVRHGLELLLAGKPEEAVAKLEIGVIAAADSPETLYNLACAYALTGRKVQAVAALERAVQLGFDDWDHMQADKDLEAIRDEPAYQELVRKIGPGERDAP